MMQSYPKVRARIPDKKVTETRLTKADPSQTQYASFGPQFTINPVFWFRLICLLQEM
jgi:hypothetical protein